MAFYSFEHVTDNVPIIIEADTIEEAQSRADSLGLPTGRRIYKQDASDDPTFSGVVIARNVEGEFQPTGNGHAQVIYKNGLIIAY